MPTDIVTTIVSDGWNDAAAEAGDRVIRGTLLKFADHQWTQGKESVPVPAGTRLVALGTAAAWVKWQGGKPVEYRSRQPGRRLPDRDELPDQDASLWEAGPDGEPRDPWQCTRFVHLVDPKTAEAFTFSTASWGGRNAVCDLADQIMRVRARHPGAVPLVELQSAPMQTKYGRKSRPVFKVVGWSGGGDSEAPALEHKPDGGEADSKHPAFDSSIPF